MKTLRDEDIDLESGAYVPVCHILKFYLDFGGNGTSMINLNWPCHAQFYCSN